MERSIRQLSGGERRRVALALCLGFAEVVAQRGNLQCNLLVLDEVSASHFRPEHHFQVLSIGRILNACCQIMLAVFVFVIRRQLLTVSQ